MPSHSLNLPSPIPDCPTIPDPPDHPSKPSLPLAPHLSMPPSLTCLRRGCPTSPPITSPVLSLATHPDFSRPLSAVLRAGDQSPGSHYSRSPSVASLAGLLSHHSSPKAPETRTSEGRAWWDGVAALFGLDGPPARATDRRASTGTVDVQPANPSLSDLTTSGVAADALAPDVVPEDLEQRPFRKPRYPLVLCHGLLGFDLIGPQAWPPLRISYWRGVREALEEKGVEVYVARVPASASIEERARILAEFIEKELDGRKVNLIGHSMGVLCKLYIKGGLDCRFMISHLKPTSFKVASLTTIATPHRGSSFADYMLFDVLGRSNLPKLLQLTSALGIPGGGKAFEDLTTERMARFNATTPDHPKVVYFSYGAAFEPGFASLFRVPWGVLYEREGPNDGVVSVKSAKWGTYLGTLEDVHHIDLVGWTGVKRWKSLVDEWGGKKGFQAVEFFVQVAELLAEKGF